MKQRLTLLTSLMFFFLTGCNGTKEIVREVPVEVHDTTDVTHIEYVFRTDTLINNTETIIREANSGDSALLARLGLQLEDNKKTILVLRSELQQVINQLEHAKQDSTYHHNETPIPINNTEIVEKEKELSWLQKTLMGAGVIGLVFLMAWFAWRRLKGKFAK